MINFTQCGIAFTNGLANNYSSFQQYIFQGTPDRIPKNTSSQINLQGCIDLCGSTAQYYDFSIISNTITTWVLPIIGVLLQGPFEPNETWQTILDICRWVGSPIASLSYILWNIRVIGKCAMMIDMSTAIDEPWPEAKLWREAARARSLHIRGLRTDSDQLREEIEAANVVRGNFLEMRDSLYILQAMNQYSMIWLKPRSMDGADYSATSAEGLLRIALFSEDLNLKLHCKCLDHPGKLREARAKLALMLRTRRKRGIIPVFISMFWFVVSLALSIQSAFTGLGINSTAHDLATGLLLGWLPCLILCSIADRNPTDPDGNREDLNEFVSSVCVSLLDKDIFNDYVAELKRKYDFPCSYGDIEDGLLMIRKLCKALVTVDSKKAPRLPPLAHPSALDIDQLHAPKDDHSEYTESGSSSRQNPTPVETLSDSFESIIVENERELPKVKFFGAFAGQGRRRWHYGAAHPILSEIEDAFLAADKTPMGRQLPGKRNWLCDKNARVNIVLGKLYQRRGLIWWDFRELWQVLGATLIVCGTGFGAFIISYNTPTIGLGCRSGSFMIFMLNSIGLFLVELLTWRADWVRFAKHLVHLALTARLPGLANWRRRRLDSVRVEGISLDEVPEADRVPGHRSKPRHTESDTRTVKDSLDVLDWSPTRTGSPRHISIVSPYDQQQHPLEPRLTRTTTVADPVSPRTATAAVTRQPLLTDHRSQPQSEGDPAAYEVYDPIGKRKYIGYALAVGEASNAAFLCGVVCAQAVGGFDTCACMTSQWGLGSQGAYLDFNDFTIARPNIIILPWTLGTVIGSLAMFAGLLYIVVEWLLQSHMSTLNIKDAENGLRRVRCWRKYTVWIRRARETFIDIITICFVWLIRRTWSALTSKKVDPTPKKKMRWTAEAGLPESQDGQRTNTIDPAAPPRTGDPDMIRRRKTSLGFFTHTVRLQPRHQRGSQ